MKILEIKVLKGPNYWSVRRTKLIQMKLDLEEKENMPTNKIINSFVKILRQGKISFEDLRILAAKNSLSLSIKNEIDLDCSILKFIKIK